MKRWGAVLVLTIGAVTGCVTGAGGADPGTAAEPLETAATEQEDQRLRIDTTIDDGDGLFVRAVVAVGHDQEHATLEYEGATQTLDWNRQNDAACRCRVFQNESYLVTVTFPADPAEATAVVKAKGP